MVAIAPHAANRLDQQSKRVTVERTLQTAHHRNLVLQATLEMDSTALLEIFRMVGRNRQIGNYPQFTEDQIEMSHR